jgi:hypothetical protein
MMTTYICNKGDTMMISFVDTHVYTNLLYICDKGDGTTTRPKGSHTHPPQALVYR